MNDPRLRISVTGIELKHPVMNASGILASSPGGVEILASLGVSAIVSKTLTLKPREGYLPPITTPLDYGLLNAVGLANPGIGEAPSIVNSAHGRDLPVIISIGGGNPEEYHELAVKALEAGADGLELNLSCPHTPGYGVDSYSTVRTLRQIAVDVKSVSEKPVWGKLGYSRRIVEEAAALLDGGVDAIVLINTLPGMIIDPYARRPILSHGYGGLSGPALHPVAVYSVYKVYSVLQPVIIGVGGVVDWRSAVELLLAGASAVQVGSGFYTVGYNVVGEILDGLMKYLDKTGIKTIEEVIGGATRF